MRLAIIVLMGVLLGLGLIVGQWFKNHQHPKPPQISPATEQTTLFPIQPEGKDKG